MIGRFFSLSRFPPVYSISENFFLVLVVARALFSYINLTQRSTDALVLFLSDPFSALLLYSRFGIITILFPSGPHLLTIMNQLLFDVI